MLVSKIFAKTYIYFSYYLQTSVILAFRQAKNWFACLLFYFSLKSPHAHSQTSRTGTQ